MHSSSARANLTWEAALHAELTELLSELIFCCITFKGNDKYGVGFAFLTFRICAATATRWTSIMIKLTGMPNVSQLETRLLALQETWAENQSPYSRSRRDDTQVSSNLLNLKHCPLSSRRIEHHRFWVFVAAACSSNLFSSYPYAHPRSGVPFGWYNQRRFRGGVLRRASLDPWPVAGGEIRRVTWYLHWHRDACWDHSWNTKKRSRYINHWWALLTYPNKIVEHQRRIIRAQCFEPIFVIL